MTADGLKHLFPLLPNKIVKDLKTLMAAAILNQDDSKLNQEAEEERERKLKREREEDEEREYRRKREREREQELDDQQRDMETRKMMMEYAQSDTITRLTMEPMLDRLLQPRFPDGASRTSFIRSLAAATNKRTAEYAGVYVIKVEGLPFTHYVGSSSTVIARIEQHRRGEGGACTRNATSIEQVELTTQGGADKLDSWEREQTLSLMYTLGVDKVRGWHYVQHTHSDSDRREIFRNICSFHSLCYRCGFGSHQATKCFARRCASWMGGNML